MRIKGYSFGEGEQSACIVGATRGNEVQQLYICSRLINIFKQLEHQGKIRYGKTVMVVPTVNSHSMNIGKRFWSTNNTDKPCLRFTADSYIKAIVRFFNQTIKLFVAEVVRGNTIIFFIGNMNRQSADGLPARVLWKKHDRKGVVRDGRAELRVQCVSKLQPFDSTTFFIR